MESVNLNFAVFYSKTEFTLPDTFFFPPSNFRRGQFSMSILIQKTAEELRKCPIKRVKKESFFSLGISILRKTIALCATYFKRGVYIVDLRW